MEEGPEEGKPRLLALVEVTALQGHPSRRSGLELAEVADPDFPGMSLQVVVDSGRWRVGYQGYLLAVGAQVPRDLNVGGVCEAVLAQAGWKLQRPLTVANQPSYGLLLPVEAVPDGLELEALPLAERRAVFEMGFVGNAFQASVGSDASVEKALCNALWQVGAIPSGVRPKFQRPSRTDVGVHARSFRLATPLLRMSGADLRPDGRCPGLTDALNRRLPKELRVFEVARVPFSANLSAACTSREYRYYLPRAMLDLGADGEACLRECLLSYVGTHCFANFTRLDLYAALERELRSSAQGEQWLQESCGHRRRRRQAGFPADTRYGQELPEVVRSMTTRTVLSADLLPDGGEGGLLTVRLVGSGFLNGMVRLLVGVACAVAAGILERADAEQALEARCLVDLSELMAPARGLVLFSQGLDVLAAPWLPPGRCEEQADAFLRDAILPEVRKEWARRPPSLWPELRRVSGSYPAGRRRGPVPSSSNQASLLSTPEWWPSDV